jgi:hypothetical protein
VTEFASPDLPAYWCYAIVFVVALVVSFVSVNLLLSQYPNRWGFSGTILLFAAYTILPVVLFWFLDYVSALHDTSLFAAVVVAFGYRQIFAGGVQGIALPGQTPLLWKPFEAWVRRVADAVQTRQKEHLDLFTEAVKDFVRASPERLKKFEALVKERTKSFADLQKALAEIDALPPEAGVELRRVCALWTDLRLSEPDHWGYLLYRAGLIPFGRYWLWLKDGRSILISGGLTLIVITVALLASQSYAGRRTDVTTRFYQWRALKPTSTEADRFRTTTYLEREVRQAPTPARVHDLLGPLVSRLSFKDLPAKQTDDLLRMLVNVHSTAVDAVVFAPLIEALRTENPYTRAAVQRVLLGLANADFPQQSVPDDLKGWQPSKDDTALDVDRDVREWQAWLARLHASQG